MSKLTFWVLTIVPALIIAGLFIFSQKEYAVIAFLIYVLIYRPIIDSVRLLSFGSIEKKDVWKMVLPFYRFKFFNTLYLK